MCVMILKNAAVCSDIESATAVAACGRLSWCIGRGQSQRIDISIGVRRKKNFKLGDK